MRLLLGKFEDIENNAIAPPQSIWDPEFKGKAHMKDVLKSMIMNMFSGCDDHNPDMTRNDRTIAKNPLFTFKQNGITLTLGAPTVCFIVVEKEEYEEKMREIIKELFPDVDQTKNTAVIDMRGGHIDHISDNGIYVTIHMQQNVVDYVANPMTFAIEVNTMRGWHKEYFANPTTDALIMSIYITEHGVGPASMQPQLKSGDFFYEIDKMYKGMTPRIIHVQSSLYPLAHIGRNNLTQRIKFLKTVQAEKEPISLKEAKELCPVSSNCPLCDTSINNGGYYIGLEPRNNVIPVNFPLCLMCAHSTYILSTVYFSKIVWVEGNSAAENIANAIIPQDQREIFEKMNDGLYRLNLGIEDEEITVIGLNSDKPSIAMFSMRGNEKFGDYANFFDTRAEKVMDIIFHPNFRPFIEMDMIMLVHDF